MSPLMRGLLRPALNTTMAAALAALAVLGTTSSGSPTAASDAPAQAPTTPEITLSSASVTPTPSTRAARIAARGERVLRVAKRQEGDRYVYGGSGPNAFDCSGLTAYAYRLATGKHLPHSASAQQGRTYRISARSARPGDLVFFHSSGGYVYHVGIYAGHHTVVHAPYPGQRVKRERIWTSAVTYGRVK
ncbi:MAG TPA: NlpC/P60 family protein [Marmoricola sp.]|nr:NlpC/P60 family protein [Marmoricola sp.]